LIENCKDIIACGFDMNKTFIFSNIEYMGSLYPNVVKIEKLVSNSTVRGLFGVTLSDNIGRNAFPARQAAPSFYSSFPLVFGNDTCKNRRCLVPMGIDQDPYFRMVRDITKKLGKKYLKPALIHSKFLPSLAGKEYKMSSSDPKNAIFLQDTPKQITKKINSAFSGGQDNEQKQRELGANLDVDIPYIFLKFFLEDNEQLKKIGQDYHSGNLLTGEVKQICAQVINHVIKEHKENRARVTNQTVLEYMKLRPLNLEL